MKTPDWKRIAAERLRRIRMLERLIKVRADVVADVVLGELQGSVHRQCLASLSDHGVQQFIARLSRDAVENIRRRMGDT